MAYPTEVASIVPSSAALEARVARAADVAHARCVVELGAGTGGTTRALLRAMPPEARLLAIEINADFCSRMGRLIDDPRFEMHLGSAEMLTQVLHQHRLPAADVVVTGIPFSALAPETALRVAAAICDNVKEGGRVVAYQCRSSVVDYLAPHLGEPRATWEWRSVPPMRVFVWIKG